MNIEVGIARGCEIKDVFSKKFNIYMGISLNNKWFTKENIKSYILWGLKYTKSKFGIVIADKLQAINYEVRSKYSKKAAERKALREGEKFLTIIENILSELPDNKRKLVDILRWEDLRQDSFYKEAFPVFLKKFEKDNSFRKEIKRIVIGFTSRLDEQSISEEKLERLCLYVIDEFPEILGGFTFKNTFYNCILYPSDGPLLKLIDKIQNKERFPEVYDELKHIRKNVFVELKIKSS